MGSIDESGRVIIPFEFDDVFWLDKDWAAVQVKGKWGFINTKKEVTTPFIYDEIVNKSNGLVKVKFNDKYGYVDKFGNDTFC